MSFARSTLSQRSQLQPAVALASEFSVLVLLGSVVGALLVMAGRVSAPYQPHIQIDLSLTKLPYYVSLSLCRGLAAYGLSLVFALTYGSLAARNKTLERFMIPALDVLQAIPVLGFLPGLVLAMIALFPSREIGLELACIIMIFTGQAWNMTFSFHSSLKSVPTNLREVARLNGLDRWKTFRLLSVPASMVGLVWNSMMSMAGGWFFLMVNEAFTLGERDYRLPGIGSYMNEATHQGNVPAMIAAVVAMIVMIVGLDQLLWRPVVVWSQRYKVEELEEPNPPRSWFLELIKHSRFLRQFLALLAAVPTATPVDRTLRNLSRARTYISSQLRPSFRYYLSRSLIAVGGLAFLGWGAIGVHHLLDLLLALPLSSPKHSADWIHVTEALGYTFLRTSSAVLLGALWATPVGILIGRSATWSRRLQPVIQVLASFPAPMLFPILTIALDYLRVPFSIGSTVLMLMGAQWYILFNVIAGASAVPGDLAEVGKVNRLRRLTVWKHLYLPSVFPYLVTGLVTAAGGAWNAAIVSEYVQMKNQTYSAMGVGSLISEATAQGNFPLLAASVCSMALAVVLINRIVWRPLYKLAADRYSLNV